MTKKTNITETKDGLIEIATGSGNLQITELQPEGKRRMTAYEYLKGYQLKAGDKFGPK